MRDLPEQGDRVCIVQMDGCMAHVRGAERWGKIIRIGNRVVYGSPSPSLYADIEFDDGSTGAQYAGDMFRSPDGHFEMQI